MRNFWENLPRPFFVLAPMYDVTDTVFRRIVSRVAKPDVFFTEFVNVESFCAPKGRSSAEMHLAFETEEAPLVAQIWGLDPDHYYEMARELSSRGFAGIDINMGCPERNVVASGACSALINDPVRALEIIKATRAGAGDIPVSVKTRIGLVKIETERWASQLLELNLPALTIHGRTAKEMSKVPAHWDEIGKVVKLRDEIAPNTLIVGNGDVMDRAQGMRLVKEYDVDGIMIGRGIFQNIASFSKTGQKATLEESLELLISHAQEYANYWADRRPYDPIKKFFKVYASGFAGASDLRQQLMDTKRPSEAIEITREFLAKQPTSVV